MLRFRVSAIAISVIAFLLVPLSTLASSGRRSGAYTDPDAYAVYSAVLPHLWPWTQLGAHHPVLINETKPFAICLPPAVSKRATVASAIAQYKQANQQVWMLEPKLHVSRPYTLIGPGELGGIARHEIGAWDLFFERHGGSGGWIQFSAVGFSADKKTALVYAAYRCGGNCGGGALYLLHKKGQQWQFAGPLPSCEDPLAARQMTGF